MILTDRLNTFTMAESDDTATPIQNASLITTIGGIRKTQADSKRLKITSVLRVPQDATDGNDIGTLSAILSNFSAALYYTPQRKLWDRSAIEEIEVVLASDPSIVERLYNCGVVFHVSLEFEEVI